MCSFIHVLSTETVLTFKVMLHLKSFEYETLTFLCGCKKFVFVYTKHQTKSRQLQPFDYISVHLFLLSLRVPH